MPRAGCAVLALVLAGAAGARAQRQPDTAAVRVVPVAQGIWMLTGAGGNMALAVGDQGALLVDADYARTAPRLAAAIGALTSRPLRFVLDTHWHPDHVEGNAALAGLGATVVAQDNAGVRLSTEQGLGTVRFPPPPPAGRPAITFRDTLTFHLGGSDAVAAWAGPAHTDGDVVVFWRRANVIHAGDLVVDYGYPFVDAASGGDASGMVAALDRLLAASDARTRIIRGHGPIGTRSELVEYRDMLAAITGRIAGQLAAGRTLAEITASKPTAGFDARWARPGSIPPDTFVAMVYRSLLPRPRT